MQAEDAVRIYTLATPDERQKLEKEVRDKILTSDKPAARQDEWLAQTGIAPPIELPLDRELHALNQGGRDEADARRQGQSLMRQSAAASGAGDKDKAILLRQQAIDLMKGSRQDAVDAARRRRLEAAHQAIGRIRRQIEEGSVDRDTGEGQIRRILGEVSAGLRKAA